MPVPFIVAALPYVAAAVTTAVGVSQLLGGNEQQKYAEEQKRLAQTQARQLQELTTVQNEQELAAAIRLSGAMQGEAAGMWWAAQQATEAAGRNAENILSQGAEIVRKKRLQHKQTESMTKARQAASGIRIGRGSAKRFRRDLGRENVAERNAITAAFASQAEVARQQGVVQSAELSAAAGGSMAGAASVLIEQQDAARLRTMEADFAMTNAGLVNTNVGSGNLWSGLGNIASGLGGFATALSGSGGGGGTGPADPSTFMNA